MFTEREVLVQDDSYLTSVLAKAHQGLTLDVDDILYLLHIEDADQLQELYDAACRIRDTYFGNNVYLYGFLYLSTYCQNSCAFCYFSRNNSNCTRYRKSTDEIIHAARMLQDSGVHLLDLTMGEDPYFHNRSQGAHALVQMLEDVRAATSLPFMISPGVLPYEVLKDIKTAGVSWYACYQETYSRELFQRLRCGQSFSQRLTAKKQAQDLGFLTEEGILCDVGESYADLAQSLMEMGRMDFDQLRAMTFVPQAGTPLERHRPAQPDLEQKLIAILRILHPSKLIPASLDVGGLQGLQERLAAGANVVTSIVPPGCGLSGVANHALDIENFNRTVERISSRIDSLGLRIGTLERYTHWMHKASSKWVQNNQAQ